MKILQLFLGTERTTTKPVLEYISLAVCCHFQSLSQANLIECCLSILDKYNYTYCTYIYYNIKCEYMYFIS